VQDNMGVSADGESALNSVINLIDHRMNQKSKMSVRQLAAADPDEIFLSIIMPAYNEGGTIRDAVNHVLTATYPCRIELIVVDDGSSDDTAEQLGGLSCDQLTVVRHRRNHGKGAALCTGIKLARGTHMLPFDADLEYSAADIARVLQPVIEGRAEVVYGTRLFGVNTVYHSFRYKLGNRATTLAANLLFDSALTDMHTCMKLVPLKLLRQMHLVELGFGLDTEITAYVLKMGYRPFEVPVSYYARSHLEGKKINWKDGIQCLKVLGRVRIAATPDGRGGRLGPTPGGRPSLIDVTTSHAN
jgi:glycosyltransferase involved in cell wall biosynthesis